MTRAASRPDPSLPPPLDVTQRRIMRRRRLMMLLAMTAVVAVAVAGGFVGVQRLVGEPTRFIPALPPPASTGVVPWVSAMVARDGVTVTVYSGAERCRELANAVAAVAVDGQSRVEIAVTARIVEATDCATSGRAMPLVVTLSAPLGGRELADAATGQPRPTYLEQHLPDISADGRWTPVGRVTWPSQLESWHDAYNGPNGSSIDLSAQPVGSPRPGKRVGTIALGPYRGTINRLAFWTVYWEVEEVIYSLALVPNEGGEFTIDQFKQELARLTWR